MSFIRNKNQLIKTNILHIRYTKKFKNDLETKNKFIEIFSKYGDIIDCIFPEGYYFIN